MTAATSEIRATTTDVSSSGAFIATNQSVRPQGEVVLIVRRGPTETPIRLHAEVARIARRGEAAQPGWGVRWLSAQVRRDRPALERFMADVLHLPDAEIIDQGDGSYFAVTFAGASLPPIPQEASAGYSRSSARGHRSMPSDAIVPKPLTRRRPVTPVRPASPAQPNGAFRGAPPPTPPRPVTSPGGRTIPPISQRTNPGTQAPLPPLLSTERDLDAASLSRPNYDELAAEMELQDAFAPGDAPLSRPMIDISTVELPPPEPRQPARPLPPRRAESAKISIEPDADIDVADKPELSAHEHDITVGEESTGAVFKRALLTVTGKLFGRSEPVTMGSIATSSDGWFYRPDGDGALHVGRESGEVIQQFRTGSARAAKTPAPGGRPATSPGREMRTVNRRRSGVGASGGFTSPSLTSPNLTSPGLTSPGFTSPGLTSPGAAGPGMGGLRARHSATVPKGEPGEMLPLDDVPCSFQLFRELCGGRMRSASKRAVRISIEGEVMPRKDQMIEVNVPLYCEGNFHTFSLHGPLLTDSERNEDRIEFTMWIGDVTEFGFKDAWLAFLASETGKDRTPAKRPVEVIAEP